METVATIDKVRDAVVKANRRIPLTYAEAGWLMGVSRHEAEAEERSALSKMRLAFNDDESEFRKAVASMRGGL